MQAIASPRHAVASLTLAAAVLGAQPASGQLPPATFNAVVAGLVGVESRGCPEGMRSLQGFVVDSDGFAVVTARHGIAGCTSLSVTFFKPPDFTTLDRQVDVQLVKVKNRADLALLRAGDPSRLGPTALRLAPTPPPNTSIYSVARWLGARGARDKLVRIANGATILQNIAAGVTWLSPTSSPAADLDIVNIDLGTILHGTSGSPLVDDAGRVVAVADGGLEGGTSGINWAIPSRYVTELLSSNDALPTASEGRAVRALFSRAVLASGASLPTVTCGTHQLARVRSDTLDRLMAWSDDPAGLMQVVATTTLNPATTTFDVYQASASGATIILPRGVPLQSAGAWCTAQVGPRIAMKLQMERTSGTPADVQTATVLYEQQTFGPGWSLLWGYPFARPRFDGLIVMRKNLQRRAGVLFDVGYETLAALGPDLVEYSAIFSRFGVAEHQSMLWCRTMKLAGAAPPACAALIAENEDWGRAIVAVHLTTFTVGRTTRPMGAPLPWAPAPVP